MKAYTNKHYSLAAVLAHPDDESFGMGGTLALYARKGVEIHLICATRGEAGEMDPDCLEGFDSIAERRESELLCAAEQLGITSVHFLNYRDSGMSGSLANQHPQALVNAQMLPKALRNRSANCAPKLLSLSTQSEDTNTRTISPSTMRLWLHLSLPAMFTTTVNIPHIDQKSFTSTLSRRVS